MILAGGRPGALWRPRLKRKSLDGVSQSPSKERDLMADTVSWNLRLSVRAGRLEDARTLMEEMVASTRSEAGTLGYEWFLNAPGATCHIHERYADSAAVMAHLGTFGSRFADRFLQCFEPAGLAVYGTPSPEARAALDGFGAQYLATWGGFGR